jgi:hypothetical protein
MRQARESSGECDGGGVTLHQQTALRFGGTEVIRRRIPELRTCRFSRAMMLDLVAAKCLVGGNSGCWLWMDTMGKAKSSGAAIRMACQCMKERRYNVRRLVHYGLHGYSHGGVLQVSCGTTDCVSPEHVKLVGANIEDRKFSKYRTKKRSCLGCNRPYESWNISLNRHCERCREFLNNDLDPGRY